MAIQLACKQKLEERSTQIAKVLSRDGEKTLKLQTKSALKQSDAAKKLQEQRLREETKSQLSQKAAVKM